MRRRRGWPSRRRREAPKPSVRWWNCTSARRGASPRRRSVRTPTWRKQFRTPASPRGSVSIGWRIRRPFAHGSCASPGARRSIAAARSSAGSSVLEERLAPLSAVALAKAGAPLHHPLDHVADAGALADEQMLSRERDLVVSQMIRSLPPRLRDPFLLAATGEHRYEEIAAMLGIPLGTVKWRIAEARRVLRDKLARVGFGQGGGPRGPRAGK